MRRLRLVLFLLVVSAAEADTVTGRDSSSWNGLVTISDGVLKLVANFRNGKVITLKFGTYYVRSIQFNPMVYNPGSEPPASLQSQQPGVGPFRGTIYMQKRPSQSCEKSITVDRDLSRVTVSCDGKPIPGVIRIMVNNTQ